ncbi:hypothetical protein EV699_10165 [Plasticicumulans lactativorans]|uniref:Uncharacterized protein n=1 Tax=Plasticicumulans lactativorans TaxID=1133106 RepID=A0A4R2LG27_9GAMM|nr:DUF6763 family protein [Plasticicumulans lactativorans]TCO83681.1 hypothetical protein EV699_10165 [Plasticicumulans lactativorans]
MSEVDPIVGTWYRDLESRALFEVVAYDEDGRTVEVQYQDGEIEEIDADDWYERLLEAVEAPEDWAGAFDDESDLGFGDVASARNGHDDPLRGLD